MNEPNNTDNIYIRQYNRPINLQSLSRTQSFLPSVISISPSDNMSMDSIDTEIYTGDYAVYQGNFSEDAHRTNTDTRNEQLSIHLSDQIETDTNNSCPMPGFFQTLCDPCVPYSDSDTTNDGPIVNYSQHFDRQIQPSTSFSLPHNDDVTFTNTTAIDYEITGYQSSFPVSSTHPGNFNINTMNGHLNPPNHNQVDTHTSNSYSLPISFCGSAIHWSDMTNNSPTDNHFQHFRTSNNRSISYVVTPIRTQASISFNSSNVINEFTSPRYLLVTKVEESQSVISVADFDQMLATTRM